MVRVKPTTTTATTTSGGGVDGEQSMTPPNDTPFAADNIGDTVVRLDKVYMYTCILTYHTL